MNRSKKIAAGKVLALGALTVLWDFLCEIAAIHHVVSWPVADLVSLPLVGFWIGACIFLVWWKQGRRDIEQTVRKLRRDHLLCYQCDYWSPSPLAVMVHEQQEHGL